jgi:Ser/Thr protein kinase RdoA (MazF antagonist)
MPWPFAAWRGSGSRSRTWTRAGLDVGVRLWVSCMRRYPVDERRASWEVHLAFIGSQIAADDVGPRAELQAIASELASLPRSVETFGLIHFDFELDNLVWRDETIGMLDFDDAARYWYVADIAFALRDLFEDGVDLGNPSFQAFIEGYRGFCAIDDGMLVQTPLFLRLSELFGYARLTYALDLAEDEDYPEWMTGLNRRLHGWTERYRSSLAPAGG